MVWWEWMPRGFSRLQPKPHGGKLRALFLPLWSIDKRVWHSESEAFKTGYRILRLEDDGSRLVLQDIPP